MKKILFLFLPLLSFAACQKDQAPQINITFSTTPSDKWNAAQFEVSDFSFLTLESMESSSIGGSILQEWEGAMFEQNLTIADANLITENDH